MDKQVIFAENHQRYYSYNKENILEHFTSVLDDYPNRHWWERGIYYVYDLIIYKNPETKNLSIIVSYWDIKGRVLSCPDCAMTKLWYVNQIGQFDSEHPEPIRKAVKDVEGAIPHKVFVDLVRQLEKHTGIKLYSEKEIVEL